MWTGSRVRVCVCVFTTREKIASSHYNDWLQQWCSTHLALQAGSNVFYKPALQEPHKLSKQMEQDERAGSHFDLDNPLSTTVCLVKIVDSALVQLLPLCGGTWKPWTFAFSAIIFFVYPLPTALHFPDCLSPGYTVQWLFLAPAFETKLLWFNQPPVRTVTEESWQGMDTNAGLSPQDIAMQGKSNAKFEHCYFFPPHQVKPTCSFWSYVITGDPHLLLF